MISITKRRLASLVSASAIIATFAVAAGPATAEAATPALKVTVNCYSNPERTVVHNNRSHAITIKSVGSIYRPYSNEPVFVYKRLAAGATVTFYSGYGASSSNPRTLTRQYIYNNEVGSAEGARVKDTNGHTYSDRC